MSSTTKRLYIVAGIILLTYGVSRLLQAQTEPPKVVMPNWTVRDLPLQLGRWHGEKHKLDPKIVTATGAQVISDRIYRDEVGRVISLHSAMFEDPSDGVYHSPMNCYLSNGWKKISETREDVPVSDNLTIRVALTTWEKEGEKILVAFWYQLGDRVLYTRLDLGGLRWSMRGQQTWPVMIKVMAQISIADAEDAKASMSDFLGQVVQWLNQPEHQKYLGQWPGV